MSRRHENESINIIIEKAILEDLDKYGDVTSKAVFDESDTAEAVIKSKEPGVLSGVYLVEPVFKKINSSLCIVLKSEEGSCLEEGTEICRVSGPIQGILAGERITLNFLQHLSGIATHTARFVSLIQGTKAKLLDTRKTTPALRCLEKKAVIAGGGMNHRFGLFDMILIKDTHVKAAGGPAAAIKKAKKYCTSHTDYKIEVEVQSIDECIEAVKARPYRIMLDNMSLKEIAECVSYVNKDSPAIELEASGNITSENIRDMAETGVDFISVGAITHSVKALDIHLSLL